MFYKGSQGADAGAPSQPRGRAGADGCGGRVLAAKPARARPRRPVPGRPPATAGLATKSQAESLTAHKAATSWKNEFAGLRRQNLDSTVAADGPGPRDLTAGF